MGIPDPLEVSKLQESTTMSIPHIPEDSKLQESTAMSVPDILEESDHSDGGLKGWLVVFGSWCALFLVFGVVDSTSVFLAYISTHQLQADSTERIAWIFSIKLFLTFFCGIYSGIIFDLRGSKLLVAVGSLLMVASMMCLSISTKYWHFMLSYGVLGGLGGALLLVPAVSIIGHYFDRRRGFATGVANTGGPIGGVIIPLTLERLIDSVGFGWAIRVLGFLLLGLSIPANIFIRTRSSPQFDVAEATFWPDVKFFKQPRFAACAMGMFLMEWGLFVVLGYIAPSLASIGSAQGITEYTIVVLLNSGTFFGLLIPGLLADGYGRFNVIILTISLCCITVFGLWLSADLLQSQALIIVFAITFGFSSGTNLSLIPVCLSQLCSLDAYGRYLSSAFFFTSFGTLTSISIGGAILEASDNKYEFLIIFAGLAYAGACACYMFTRISLVGPRLLKEV